MTFSAIDSSPVISIDSSPMPTSIISSPTPEPAKTPAPPQKSSSRVMLWVVIGVVLIAILVVARNHNSSSTPSTSATPTASSTPSDTSPPTSATATPTASAAATPTAASTASNLAPVGIVAHYTATGAAIFWKPATGAGEITTFNVEDASSGGAFKLIATVPATQLSLNVTQTDSNGWTSFKISAVYKDGTIVAGKVFGLPGQYA